MTVKARSIFLVSILFIIANTTTVVANPVDYDQTFYWVNSGNTSIVGVGQSVQSPDFLIDTIPGVVTIGSLEFFMSVSDILPFDVTARMVLLYGPTQISFTPGSSENSQGLRVHFGVGALCGSSAYDFHLIVDFVAKRTVVDPSWSTMQQCIEQVVDFGASTFPTDGAFHVRLALYLEGSRNPGNEVTINFDKNPRMRVIFSVTPSDSSSATAEQPATITVTSIDQASSSNQALTTPAKEGITGFNILLYAVASGAGLFVVVLAIVLWSVHSRKTEVERETRDEEENNDSEVRTY